MATTSSAPIAIIGGGPCGLTFARLLEQNNVDYIVYERDANSTPTPMYQGGTLDLHGPSGQQALKDAGLFEEFQKLARYDADRTVIMDSTGTIKQSFGDGHDAPEIDRYQLRQLLLDSIPAHKVRWGHGVRTIEKQSGGWGIHFVNGDSASGFRLIVGADGAWSKVRPLLTPAKPEYSGKVFIEGRLSTSNPSYAAAVDLAGPGNMMALGNGKWVSIQQVADRSYRVYLGLQEPEDFVRTSLDLSDTEGSRQRFLGPEFFAEFSPEVKAFVADAEGPFRPWQLYRMPVSSVSWERVPGLTLLGDAAHVSTPFVGEGVNIAMYDALKLANSVRKHCGDGLDNAGGLESAVAEYEEDMFERAQDFIRRCIESENMLFAHDGAKQFVDMINDMVKKMALLGDKL